MLGSAGHQGRRGRVRSQSRHRLPVALLFTLALGALPDPGHAADVLLVDDTHPFGAPRDAAGAYIGLEVEGAIARPDDMLDEAYMAAPSGAAALRRALAGQK